MPLELIRNDITLMPVDAVAQVRACAPLTSDWKREIDEDYAARG